MPDFPLFQTPRLLLREITEADAEDLFRIHSDAGHAPRGSDPKFEVPGRFARGAIRLLAAQIAVSHAAWL